MSVGNPSRPRHPEAHSRIAAEALCYSCGYNMHLQEVHADQETGLPIVRCPECGTGHDPAALREDPNRRIWRWLSRLLWIGKLPTLCAIGLMLGVVGALQHLFGVEGWFVIFAEPHPDLGETLMNLFLPPGGPAMFLIFLGGVSAGGVFWQRHWAIRMALAAPVSLFVLLMDLTALFSLQSHSAAWIADLHATGLAAFDLLLVVAGAVFCRPVLRVLSRLLLPPQSRLSLGFLWTVDNKTMPIGRTR